MGPRAPCWAATHCYMPPPQLSCTPFENTPSSALNCGVGSLGTLLQGEAWEFPDGVRTQRGYGAFCSPAPQQRARLQRGAR